VRPHPPAKNSSNCLPALPTPSLQSGVGLIEVLIAVLVLSIGLLGVAALQDRALGNNSSAMAQSMAAMATYSILDALRADRANALAGSYNLTVTGGSCPTTTGTVAQVQLGLWCSQQLVNTLGNSSSTTGTISCNANATCTITVTFADNSGTGINTQTITTQAGI
jgi:type IV pilus assembly protein PilV